MEMLNSIVKIYDEIVDVLLDRKEEHLIDNIDVHLARDTIALLEPFKYGSEILSGNEEPTLHLVLPFVKKFKQTCEIKFTDSEPIKEVKHALLAKIDEKIWLSDLHYIATFLCPETKCLSVS